MFALPTATKELQPAPRAFAAPRTRDLPLAISRATPGKTQPKLAIGAVNDPLETEAHRVAAQVLRSPQSRPGNDAPTPATQPGSPQPLDPASRTYFEPRFGYDFSKVRIHADQQAAQSAQSIGALAYTSGANITFGDRRYQPATSEGRRLLAHELTHVVQQGQASPIAGGSRVSVASGQATPLIQRDTPGGQAAPAPPPTAQYGPRAETLPTTVASRLEVTQALTDFLYKVQAAQGGQTLHVTDSVRWAVRPLFQGDAIGSAQIEAFLAQTGLPSSPPEFAAAVTKLLPASIPRARMAHLATQAPKETPDTRPKSAGDAAGHVLVDSTVAPLVKKLPISKALKDKIVEGARSAVADGIVAILDQALSGAAISGSDKSAIHSAVEALIKQKSGTPMDRKQDGAGSPYAPPPVQPPASNSPFGSTKAPGEHIFTLPKIPWDFPTPAPPKPNLPKPPAASDAQAVSKIVDSIDDQSLIPAAAKGKPEADNYAGAKYLASSLANLLAAADKKKQYSVELNISADYRRVEDLPEIFDKIEAIVRQIAAALPGGAANVHEVIISPARRDKNDYPARRIVRLHGGD
jgi:hypothetical protein